MERKGEGWCGWLRDGRWRIYFLELIGMEKGKMEHLWCNKYIGSVESLVNVVEIRL